MGGPPTGRAVAPVSLGETHLWSSFVTSSRHRASGLANALSAVRRPRRSSIPGTPVRGARFPVPRRREHASNLARSRANRRLHRPSEARREPNSLYSAGYWALESGESEPENVGSGLDGRGGSRLSLLPSSTVRIAQRNQIKRPTYFSSRLGDAVTEYAFGDKLDGAEASSVPGALQNFLRRSRTADFGPTPVRRSPRAAAAGSTSLPRASVMPIPRSLRGRRP
jgi:hypothetical protein